MGGKSWISLPQKGLEKPSYTQLMKQCSNLSSTGQGNPVICPSAANQAHTQIFVSLFLCQSDYICSEIYISS